MAAAFHFEGAFGDGEGVRDAPVACGVEPEAFALVGFEDVDGAGRCALAFWIEGHAGPVSLVEDEGDGVFLDVVDDDFVAVEVWERSEGIEDEFGAFEFVLKVRGVDEDGEVVIEGDLDVFLEDGEFVAGVFVESDFADAEDGGAVDEFGDE